MDWPMFQAYRISCLTTGRAYIGITSRSLKRRWAEHVYDGRSRRTKMAISRAIGKYGAGNFRIEGLCCARSWPDICASESILIEQHRTRAPYGYNLSSGGDGAFGVKHTPEAIERSAAKHRGKPCHPNTRAAASRTHAGKPKSAETRMKISAARKGKPRSEETKAKISVYWARRRAAGEFKTTEPYAHSAMIAKIPLPLSRHIARAYREPIA